MSRGALCLLIYLLAADPFSAPMKKEKKPEGDSDFAFNEAEWVNVK